MKNHLESSLSAFVADCAARTPTPGGGSGSALIAATGAALGAMAARFTVGKKGHEQFNEQIEAAITRLDALREDLLRMVNEDCAAYGSVSDAYGLPRSTDAEKAARSEAIQAATLEAMQAPLRAIRLCASGLETIAAITPHLNRYLVSDAGVCALALFAGVEGLALNVRINAASLRVPAATGPALEELASLRSGAGRDRDRTIQVVDQLLQIDKESA